MLTKVNIVNEMVHNPNTHLKKCYKELKNQWFYWKKSVQQFKVFMNEAVAEAEKKY